MTNAQPIVPCQVNSCSLINVNSASENSNHQYRTGRTLGSGTYAIVKEAVHIKTGKYYACKVINKKLMEGREFMVRSPSCYRALAACAIGLLWRSD
jgi:serine/threonine protein kinase